MSLPTSDDIPSRGSTFWLTVIGVWLMLFVVAGSLALALAIWNLIQAF